MTPTETFVKTVNKYPKGSTITIAGVSLSAILGMVATVYGFGTKVGVVQADFKAVSIKVEKIIPKVEKAENNDILILSEIDHLKTDLERSRLELKEMRRDILEAINKNK